MLKKIVIFLIYLLLIFKIGYTADCSFLGFERDRLDDRLKFTCSEDTSLKDNKLVFYVVGKKNEIKTVEMPGARVDFDIDEVSKNILQVSVNISVKIRAKEYIDYMAGKDKSVELTIIPEDNSSHDYKILWGGVIKNSYSPKKSKKKNLQLYRDDKGNFYVIEKGLNCYIKDDCDDDIEILDNNCNSQKCKLLKQKLGIYANFGIIHQRLI